MSENIFSMKDKVVLVTGASSGLGSNFARVLGRNGAKVIVAARRADKLEALVSSITGDGGQATAVAMDVTNPDSVASAFAEAENIYGPITVLINNAGVADSKRFLNTEEDSWDFIMDTNLKGAWRVAKEFCNRLIQHKLTGNIVNIASILGLSVSIGESTYAISKAGVVQMTKALALELANKGIRVNAICPGYFETEMNAGFFSTPKGKEFMANTTPKRIGQLHELDGALLLLASDAGSYINGVALPVDGAHLVQGL